MGVYLSPAEGVHPETLSILANRWQIISDNDALIALILTPDRLELHKRDEPKIGAIYVNFLSGTLMYRYRFCRSRNEAIARAININIRGDERPVVVDATAGFGRDAFVLAALGCRVKMIERHPVVAALLDDGLKRGYQDIRVGPWLRERLTLIHATSLTALVNITPKPEVVYIDSMYPNKKKSALVKKEMRIFQLLVGCDDDAGELLSVARQVATKRIVVKRPNYALPLSNIPAHASTKTKNHRFDIYMPF